MVFFNLKIINLSFVSPDFYLLHSTAAKSLVDEQFF